MISGVAAGVHCSLLAETMFTSVVLEPRPLRLGLKPVCRLNYCLYFCSFYFLTPFTKSNFSFKLFPSNNKDPFVIADDGRLPPTKAL